MSAAPVYVVTSTITLANAPLLSPSLLRLDLFFFRLFIVTCRANRKKKGKIKRKVFKKEEEKEKEKKKENKVGRWIRKWGIRYVRYSYVTYYIDERIYLEQEEEE